MFQEMPVLQEDKEEESLSSPSHDSEGPGSPEELKSQDPPPDERVYSMNSPDSKASVVLTSRNLWRMFDAIGTEMIVTRRGRLGLGGVVVLLHEYVYMQQIRQPQSR